MADEIQLWQVSLEGDPALLLPLLSEDERARAARFHFERDRRHFINARGSLRQLLGGSGVRFEYGPFGKPFVVGGPRFNLSHSGGMALIAICAKQEVGVDIERLREVDDAEGIARRYFSEDEVARLVRAAAAEQMRIFFECWTRKEALVKALGEGLSAIESLPAEGWSLFDVSVGPEFVAALAAPAGEWRIVRGTMPT